MIIFAIFSSNTAGGKLVQHVSFQGSFILECCEIGVIITDLPHTTEQIQQDLRRRSKAPFPLDLLDFRGLCRLRALSSAQNKNFLGASKRPKIPEINETNNLPGRFQAPAYTWALMEKNKLNRIFGGAL